MFVWTQSHQHQDTRPSHTVWQWHSALYLKLPCSSSGVEQQRGGGRVHGPGGAVRLGEGQHRSPDAPAEEARPADGRRDARHHRREDCHIHSAAGHVIPGLQWLKRKSRVIAESRNYMWRTEAPKPAALISTTVEHMWSHWAVLHYEKQGHYGTDCMSLPVN